MKAKGKGLSDKFYTKVQDEVIQKLVDGDCLNPLVLEWNEQNWYVSMDHIVFYVIPKGKWFLREDFERQLDEFFPGKQFVKDVYWGEMEKCSLTGTVINSRPMDVRHPGPLIEIKNSAGCLFIQDEKLSCFPKQRVYCTLKSNHTGPVLIFSSLKTLLGGIMPIRK